MNMEDKVSEDEVKLITGDTNLNELRVNLSAADKVVLSGAGVIPLTPKLLAEIGESLKARHADIEARYPKLVEECPYETRLAVTAWVFQNIIDQAEQGGTFRYLIYERLGFSTDAYVPLYEAGGMTISNEFSLKGDTSGGPGAQT